MSVWQAARSHPRTYPGTHPEGDFALVDAGVGALDRAGADLDGLRLAGVPLADELAGRDLPGLDERVPVLAYGGNRSPATLALKLDHYGYASPGRGLVLPVLTARLRGYDVVAGGLSGQGYLYADLYADERTAGTELSVHVMLLDPEQLRVMNDSEGVRTGLYDVAAIGPVQLDGLPGDGGRIRALAYLGHGPVVVSPGTGSPLAYAPVVATGRTLPEFDAVGLLAHVLEALDLTGPARAVVAAGLEGDAAPDGPLAVAEELMRYLNGQWWYRQHTGEPRLRACERLEALIAGRLRESASDRPGPDAPQRRHEWLTADEAYRPGPQRTLGAALAAATITGGS